MRTKNFFAIAMALGIASACYSQATTANNAVSATDYLGTSNNNDIVFKRNGTSAGKITTNKVVFGVNAGINVTEAVVIGGSAGQYATSGSSHPANVYIGLSSGAGTSTTANSGVYNTFIGAGSGATNSVGGNNCFFGNSAGSANTNGYLNTYLGSGSGYQNNGTNNVFIGADTGGNSITVSNSIFIGNSAGVNETESNKLYIENSISSTPLIWGDFNDDQLKLNGKVGIGAVGTFPTNIAYTNYKLFVTGGMLADEVRVKLSGSGTWPDYVFLDDYKLPSLEEVENYIEANGRLKNVPSAKEVEENGIEVGQITKIQQQKIEELTLYLIQQNKEIEALKAQVQLLLERK